MSADKKSPHYHLGKKGEVVACAHLKTCGYTIIAENYTCPQGEIDVIARQKKTLCFIEIKTRSTTAYGLPSAAVTKKKQENIIRTARSFLARYPQKEKDYRFDVVEVMWESGADACREIRIIKDAFTVE